MVKLVNRAKMTTATTGTGTITLGSAVDGFQTFDAAGVADADVVRYVIEDGDNWEIGTGTYTASGSTLTRTPSESSIGGGAITLSGDAVVFVSAASDDLQEFVDFANTFTLPATDGSNGQVLTTDGSGGLTFEDAGGGGGLGIGQTWQDVTNSRSRNTTYQNTTGGPIYLSIIAETLRGFDNSLRINGTGSNQIVCQFAPGIAFDFQSGNVLEVESNFFTFTAVIPDGDTYFTDAWLIHRWWELR